MAGLPAGEQSELACGLAQYDEASKLYRPGRYADSEKLLRAILDVCRRTLGEDHPDTATATTTWPLPPARGSTPRPRRSVGRPWRSA